MNYQAILEDISKEVWSERLNGQVASYIPELAKINAEQFGIHLTDLKGENYGCGQHQTRFSIQSISKVLSLSLAFSIKGNDIWKRVGVEPSGNPFNSLVQLEYEKGIPRNPLINSGALVVADILVSTLQNSKQEFLAFVRNISGHADIDYNIKVAQSEEAWGFRNRALANFLKSFGNIENEVDEVLDFYFHQCAIEMSCQELAHTFLLFANHGKTLDTSKVILSSSQIKRMNALMQTCGFYDEAGEFSFKVGLPGKSGVGGGIVAIYPGQYSVAVWGPALNPKGNSVMGMKALELLTTKTGMSIF